MNVTEYRARAMEILATRHSLEFERLVNEIFAKEVVRKVALAHIEATHGNRIIEGIKILRSAFNLGLKEAKDAYDAARADYLAKDDLPF